MTNWSLVLNVFLLAGVVLLIFRTMRTTKQEKTRRRRYPAEPPKAEMPQDDIIAVRKLQPTPEVQSETKPVVASDAPDAPDVQADVPVSEESAATPPISLMIFLLAKDNKQLAGYELLQTMLAAGLRFGDGQLFHRHQFSNGQGPIICSLAAATDSGVFDLQNMGSFSTRGLCLFMEASGNTTIDAERLSMMLETAKRLSENLDTYLLDDEKQPWSEQSLLRYHQLLGITADVAVPVE